MRIVFTNEAFTQYNQWIREKDRTALDKIDALLESIAESPFTGIGKPEPLKHEFSGTWSRRINKKDRLRYMVTDNQIIILSCRDHY
ncbi:MAG: Txe/YoeB family addiction module toxin [Coriobacteriales bacterium]|jgi:toxin YoeB|nr:Txe/YoeB family addiction module toxin [Coriobacteriales bacterium]